MNLFWNCVSFKMDDDRELRITSGSIMLLIAMLPRDIRRDFVSRLNEMTLAQEQEERNQVMVASDAPENEDMGQATTVSNLCVIVIVIDEDISPSPVSDAMSVDECLHVRAMISEMPEPQHERSCIILASGSDESLLPMSFVADSDSASRNHNLHDCQGQKLQTSGTKDAELIVDDIFTTVRQF